jgi:hypothetical protein
MATGVTHSRNLSSILSAHGEFEEYHEAGLCAAGVVV